MAESEPTPSIFQVVKSVIAAFAGVQSKENRELDFKHGKFSHYVIVGLIFTVLFIGVIALIVSSVIG
jgi:hypothetical protein